MAWASGNRIVPARLNRMQPRVHYKIGSGTVTGAATNSEISDTTITVDTETDGAVYVAQAVWDVDLTGSTTALLIARLKVDGALQSPLGLFGAEVSTDRGTVPQNYQGTLATAGSHTFVLTASPAASQTVQGVNCSLLVTVYEVV